MLRSYEMCFVGTTENVGKVIDIENKKWHECDTFTKGDRGLLECI